MEILLLEIKTKEIPERLRERCPGDQREGMNDFIKTTYDTSLDSQISLLPLGFSP